MSVRFRKVSAERFGSNSIPSSDFGKDARFEQGRLDPGVFDGCHGFVGLSLINLP